MHTAGSDGESLRKLRKRNQHRGPPGQFPREMTLGRVLIADDEQGVRDILGKTLFFMGYDVSVAGSGHDLSQVRRMFPNR